MNMEEPHQLLVPISYRIDGKRMTLLFQLGNSVYREVYQKVSKLGLIKVFTQYDLFLTEVRKYLRFLFRMKPTYFLIPLKPSHLFA